MEQGGVQVFLAQPKDFVSRGTGVGFGLVFGWGQCWRYHKILNSINTNSVGSRGTISRTLTPNFSWMAQPARDDFNGLHRPRTNTRLYNAQALSQTVKVSQACLPCP